MHGMQVITKKCQFLSILELFEEYRPHLSISSPNKNEHNERKQSTATSEHFAESNKRRKSSNFLTAEVSNKLSGSENNLANYGLSSNWI